MIAELEGAYLSSYFMTEEIETQSGNVMVSGRVEDQSRHQVYRSSLQASSLPRRQNHILKPGLHDMPSLTMVEKREENGR